MTASYFDAWKRGEDMAADGSLKFDTKIDTSGLEKGTGTLEKAFDRLTKAVDRLSDNISNVFNNVGQAAETAAQCPSWQ